MSPDALPTGTPASSNHPVRASAADSKTGTNPTSCLPTSRLIVVTSPKGGSGKTELTKNLAVCAALDGLDVGIADLDRQRTLWKWSERRPDSAPGLKSYQGELADAQDVINVAASHQVFIVDTPPSVEDHAADIKVLLLAADLILIPCRPTFNDTESVIPWMNLIQSFGKQAQFVLSDVNRRRNTLTVARRSLSVAGPLLPVDIPHYEDIVRAAAFGLAVPEIKGAQGTEDLAAIWAMVRRSLGL